MARSSYQTGRIEQRPRKHGLVYVLRYRLHEGDKWIEKTEELRNDKGEPCKVPNEAEKRTITKEAQKAADRRMREVNASNNGTRSLSNDSKSMTLAEFVAELWQHHKSKLKPSTAYHYDSLMKLYILPAFGPQSLREITPQDITVFFAKLNQRGLSSSYRQVIYQLLNTICETACAH